MLPDVGAGTPMTALWFIAATFLLGMTIISGVIVVLFNRALQKRDSADSSRDDRMARIEEEIREQELKSLERDGDHQKAIHKLQVEMLRCQKDSCGRTVAKEEYMGDFLSLRVEFREGVSRLEAKIDDLITRVHARVDALMDKPEERR